MGCAESVGVIHGVGVEKIPSPQRRKPSYNKIDTMDRKGWIILILCIGGLVINWKVGADRAEGQRKLDEAQAKIEKVEKEAADAIAKAKAEAKAEANPTTTGDTATGESTPATPLTPAEPVKKDDPYVLFAKVDDQDLVKYTFSNFGGGIKQAEMLNQEKVNDTGNVIVNEPIDGKKHNVIGALAKSYKDIETGYYERIEQSANSVKYKGTLEDGITVTKEWTIENGTETTSPKLKLNVTFKTAEGKSLDLSDYSITTGTAVALFEKEQAILYGWYYYEDGDYQHEESGEFSGGFFSEKKPVTNVTVENIEYFGVDNQFFGTAIFPQEGSKSTNLWASGEKLRDDDPRWVYNSGLELPSKSIGGDIPTAQLNYEVFVGPKLHKRMGSISENSDDIMHFSRFSFFAWISGLMNSALNGIHSWFSSSIWGWGYAIVLLTIFIRIIIWPLHNKSTRTMKRMSKLQPIMKELKEKHKDNPQKLNQETMKLYREYGVNPMGGCLPMLVQIPIFFGVFNMINAAVELRGEPFMWVADLSKPDHITDIMGLPINLLPILMAVTMVLQMRMTPQTGDKLQRRIFMLMPLMFFVFCYNYASALALYWTTQNIVSIGQTWLTQRMPEPELEKKAIKARQAKNAGKTADEVDSSKPRKKGFMERMAEKMEEMQDQRDAAAGKTPASKKVAQTPGQPTKKAKKRNPKTGG